MSGTTISEDSELQALKAALADRYAIERKIGSGGNASVYLARDPKHDRQVALKVLRPELAAVIGAQRFLHEIKTTANLQHPHILPLHDSGEVDGTVYYVMPFVAGESLRDRLNREKQLGVNEAVRIAREVASALDYAHRHDVIHRDIKPENILLHDGQALVADFGIALAASSAGSARLTETGISMGTPQYMSPEQVMGEREITARSDIFALGCVMYEMLVGEPPFTGPTVQAIAGKVSSLEPPSITAQRKTVPRHIESAVFTALEKLPADRFPTAVALSDALDGRPSPLQNRVRGDHAVSIDARLRDWLPWTLAGLGILSGALGITLALWSRATADPITQWSVTLPDSAPLAFIGSATLGAGSSELALSPDGNLLVYAAAAGQTTRLYMHRLGTFEIMPLPGTDGAFNPFFSPDGTRIAFFAGDQLKKVDLSGGSPSIVAEVTEPYGGVWLQDGRIVIANHESNQLASVSESGGVLTAISPQRGIMRPASMPDADQVLHQVGAQPGVLAVTSLSSGKTRFLTHSGPVESLVAAADPLFGKNPLYLETGHLVFVAPAENALLAVRFDPKTLRIQGNPVRVLAGIRGETLGAQIALSRSGRIAFAVGENAAAGRLVWADGDSRLDTLPLLPAAFGEPALAPDYTSLVIPAVTPAGWKELRMYQLNDLSRGVTDRWISPFPAYLKAIWSPDGRWLALGTTGRRRVLRFPVPFAAADTLTRDMDITDFTPDGSTAIGFMAGEDFDLATLSMQPKNTPSRIMTRPNDQMYPQLSPDGKWLAYTSSETGRWEIHLEPFPLTGQRKKISLAGGEESRWSPQGDRLYYRYRDTFFMVPIDLRNGIAGTPTQFISGPFLNVPGFSYDVSRDGRRLLLILGPAEQTTNQIRLMSGFDDHVRRMVNR